MAVPAGTFQTYDAIGIREDLSDIIFDISPMERPFMSNVARGTCTQTLHEWQTDALDAATTSNAVIEGDDATTNTAVPTIRYANRTQLLDKVPRVSSTQRAVNTAGRRDELSYQVAKRGRELVRDIEKTLCGTQAATSGATNSARVLAGVGAWLWNNVQALGASATTVTVTSGAPGTDPTAGTAVTATETHYKDNISDIWDDGGNVDLTLVGSTNKKLISGFSGIATQYRDNPQVGAGVIIGAADIFVSDFGQHNIVASRFTPTDNIYNLDTEFWEVCYLSPIKQEPLSKTGHSDRRLLSAEVTLAALEPKASGKIYTTV